MAVPPDGVVPVTTVVDVDVGLSLRVVPVTTVEAVVPVLVFVPVPVRITPVEVVVPVLVFVPVPVPVTPV